MNKQLNVKWFTDRNCAVDFITTGEWRYPVVLRPAAFNDWPLSEQREFNKRFVKLVAAGTRAVDTEEDDTAARRAIAHIMEPKGGDTSIVRRGRGGRRRRSTGTQCGFLNPVDTFGGSY